MAKKKEMTPAQKRQRLEELAQQEAQTIALRHYFEQCIRDHDERVARVTAALEKAQANYDQVFRDYEKAPTAIDSCGKAMERIARERKRITVDPKLAKLSKLLEETAKLRKELNGDG